jgi:hypothetical protein
MSAMLGGAGIYHADKQHHLPSSQNNGRVAPMLSNPSRRAKTWADPDIGSVVSGQDPARPDGLPGGDRLVLIRPE